MGITAHIKILYEMLLCHLWFWIFGVKSLLAHTVEVYPVRVGVRSWWKCDISHLVSASHVVGPRDVMFTGDSIYLQPLWES